MFKKARSSRIRLPLCDIYEKSTIIRQSENWKSDAYVYFVNHKSPNQPNSEWNFKENIILESEKFGTLILDIMMDNKIGGVELYNNLK